MEAKSLNPRSLQKNRFDVAVSAALCANDPNSHELAAERGWEVCVAGVRVLLQPRGGCCTQSLLSIISFG